MIRHWCPECDHELTSEDIIRGDEVIGVWWVCSICGFETDDDWEE